MVSTFIALWLFAYVVYTLSLIVTWDSTCTPTSVSLIQEWVELTGLQQLVGFIVSFILLVLMKKPIWHSDQKLVIALTVVCNVMGNLATNAMYTTLGSSTARIVETSQPLITFALARVLLKSTESITLSKLLSVLIIVLGVCGFVYRDESFNNWSFLLAVVLIVAFTVRNIMLKKMSSKWDSSLQKFMIVSLLSVILVFPLWLVMLANTKMLSTELSALHALSAVSHSVYNLASFNVLESVALVSHAIYTVFIKASTFLVTNILVFQEFDFRNLFFSVCVVLGTYLYWLQNNSSTKRNIWKLFLGFFVIIYLFVPTTTRIVHYFHMDYQHSVNPNPGVSISCERISTAWMYEKAIPDAMLSNIVALADQNPSIPLHVYCGSTQCLEAMETRKRTNMDVKFAVVSDIVKGLTVLEDWLARHPINKVLAGREFETHIQEVTIIGILWQHGGIYVSPVLKLARDFGDVCQNATSWVTKNITQLSGNLESILDLSFFAKHHPFVYKLAHLYAKKYPTTISNSSVLRQGFLNTMLKQNPCTAHCPKVLRGIPEILKSDYSLTKQSQGMRHFGLLSRNQSATVAGLDCRMQEFAMAHFLPFINTFMDLDDPSNSVGNGDITVFLSGMGQTEKWQPQRNVKPIVLSLHLQESIDGSAAKIEYLREKEPIGCVDFTTLDFLTNRNVSSFLSGSLMLQLSNPISKKIQRKGILLSNLEDEVIKLLPTEIKNGALHLEQSVRDGLSSNDTITRFEATHQLMEKYKTTGLVITQSFHCASACAALGTPVIFVNTVSSVASVMTSLFHTLDLHSMNKDQAKQWFANVSWKDIPPNPGVDSLMKLRATAWNVIRQNQVLFDTAKKLGVIPMSPPRNLPEDQKILFHMIHTSSNENTLSTIGSNHSQSGAFNWRQRRSVESVFRHHPTSKLIFHSNTLTQRTFDVLTEVGYSIVVSTYDLEELLKGSPADAFLPKLKCARKSPYWVYNEANLLRYLSMYIWGGVYLDTDIYLVRSLYTLRKNGAGFQSSNTGTSLNIAFLYFEKGHLFIREVLETFALTFDGFAWARNGPTLITKVWDKWKEHNNHTSTDEHSMQPYGTNYFYMLNWSTVKKDCFETVGFDKYMKLLHTQAYGLHINAKITGDVGTTGEEMKKGTLCSYLLNEFCVLCNTVY